MDEAVVNSIHFYNLIIISINTIERVEKIIFKSFANKTLFKYKRWKELLRTLSSLRYVRIAELITGTLVTTRTSTSHTLWKVSQSVVHK